MQPYAPVRLTAYTGRRSAVIQQTIYKKMGVRGPIEAYGPGLARTDWFRKNKGTWTAKQIKLIRLLHGDDDIDITAADVEALLAAGNTDDDFDTIKPTLVKTVTVKPNEQAKKEHKRKSLAARTVSSADRTSRKPKGERLRKRSREVMEEVSEDAAAGTLYEIKQFAKGVLGRINALKATPGTTEHRESTTVRGITLDCHVQDISTITTVDQVLANIHVRLRGTDLRSAYAALANPDPGQTKGVLHPLHDYKSNDSFRVWNALELLRAKGDFIPSMLLKRRAFKRRKLDVPKAIDPATYGVHELSGVAGKDRALYSDRIAVNTIRLLEQRDDDSDTDSLVDAFDDYLDGASDDESRKKVRTKMKSEIGKFY